MDNFNIRFVASNNAERSKGLMFAKPLDENEVALFVFPHNDRFGFWNKNVPFKLSLAFLDENQQIVDIKDLDELSEKTVYPDREARYVVEAKNGIFERLNIKLGDYLVHDVDKSQMKIIKS
jgi:uncharacterized protein